MDTRFHCVYLLTSLDPLCQGEYYIGYTVNPVRRLRQHNGELVNGARRTSRRGRPWTMVCCVSGFVEDRAALKFEWCWQHPHESARIKHLPQFITLFMRQPNRQYRGMTRRDVSFAVAILHLLLRATLFSRLDLTLHVLDRLRFDHAVGEAQTRIKLLHRVSHPVAGETSSARGMCATDPTSPHVVLCESSSVLPSLTESDLFHVEEIDLHGFEEKYLSHDRCLSMDETWAMLGQTRCPDISANASTTNNQTPLAGTPNTSSVRTLRKEQSGLARGTYTDADKSCFGALSCVYDIKALSQNIREEWPEEEDTQQLPPAKTSSARWEDEEVCVSDTDTPKMSKTMIETDQSGPCGFVDGAHVAAVPGEAEHSLTHYEHDAADGDANHNEEDELTLVGGATQLCSPSYASRPCATRSISPVPLSTQAVCTSSHLPQRRYVPGRIPLRFRYYTELDYARLHKLECELMRVKLLPCTLCGLPLQAPYIIRCPREPHCSLRTHIVCLAMWFHYEHDQARRDRDMVDECAPATKQSDRADNGNKGTDCNGCDDGSDDNSDNSSDSSCPSSDDEAHIKYPKTDNRSCDNGLQTSSRTTAKTNAATTNMGGDADSHKHNDLLAAADADTCNGHGRSTILYPPVPHVDLIPTHPCPCPLCHEKLLWPCLVRALKQRVGKERRAQAVQRRALMEQRLQQRLQSLTTGSAASPKRAKRRRENENDGTTDRSSLPLRLPAIEANKVATAPAPSVRSASPITHRGQIRRRKQVREGGESPLREHGAVFPLEESSQTMPLGTCATVDDHAKQASKRYTRAGYYAGTTTETFRADTNNSFTALQPQSNSENSTTMLLGLTEFNEEEWLNM